MNSTQNAANLYANLAPVVDGGRGGAGFAQASALSMADSLLPFYASQAGDSIFQQVAKSVNYNQSNPPLKDDSGVTFNNSALPMPRKRPRESSTANTPVMNSGHSSGGYTFVPAPTGKVFGRCGGVATAGNVSFLGEDLSLQMMQQQLEVDRLISLHMEKVRQEIEERRRKQSSRIIHAIQEAVVRKLRDKEEQIEKVGKLNWALEERVKSLCVENQIWRDLAQTNEATANALRSNLELVLSQANTKNDRILSGSGAAPFGVANDDAESCCGSSGHGCDNDGEEVDGGQVLRWRKVARTGERREAEEEERSNRMCRKCGTVESNVLLLPCRHLCLCTACAPAVDACPICNSAKNASVHVNLS